MRDYYYSIEFSLLPTSFPALSNREQILSEYLLLNICLLKVEICISLIHYHLPYRFWLTNPINVKVFKSKCIHSGVGRMRNHRAKSFRCF